MHLEGTAVVQAGLEASLEVEPGQHVVEIYLVGTIIDNQGERFNITSSDRVKDEKVGKQQH